MTVRFSGFCFCRFIRAYLLALFGWVVLGLPVGFGGSTLPAKLGRRCFCFCVLGFLPTNLLRILFRAQRQLRGNSCAPQGFNGFFTLGFLQFFFFYHLAGEGTRPLLIQLVDLGQSSRPDSRRRPYNFVVLYRNFRSLPFLGLLGFLVRQLIV